MNARTPHGLRDAALDYAARGIQVLPIWSTMPYRGRLVCACARLNCKSPAKHPIAPMVRRGLNDATTDPARIDIFWRSFPDANVGAAMGRIVAIDIDPRHGGDVAALGPLPVTWRAATGGGGEHLYFLAPSSPIIRNTAGKLGAGSRTEAVALGPRFGIGIGLAFPAP